MMRNLSRYAAGAVAGILLTATAGAVISAIAAKTEVNDVAVRQVIDLSATANGEAKLTDLQINPLKGLELVVKLPEGATTAHSITVKASYDADSSDAPADKVDQALNRVIDVRATPGDPTSALDDGLRNITQTESDAKQVDYLVTIDELFEKNTQNGLAYVDLKIELSA